jgi:hypothetical protein
MGDITDAFVFPDAHDLHPAGDSVAQVHRTNFQSTVRNTQPGPERSPAANGLTRRPGQLAAEQRVAGGAASNRPMSRHPLRSAVTASFGLLGIVPRSTNPAWRLRTLNLVHAAGQSSCRGCEAQVLAVESSEQLEFVSHRRREALQEIGDLGAAPPVGGKRVD